jgi:hypothetical protein
MTPTRFDCELPMIGQDRPPRAKLVVYRQWVGNGWQLADSLYTPVRGTFIADPAPKAQLVRLPGH